MANNTVKHSFGIKRDDRREMKKHSSFLIWFTGLSGSGKSTIANDVEQKLFNSGINTYILDGDNMRLGLNKDLGFSSEDRVENIRRIGEVANLFIDAGVVVLAAFISPYINNREEVMQIVGRENYFEVYVSTSLQECEQRDVKGLYSKARTGEIRSFTGISAPYEPPVNPDIEIDTENMSVEEAATRIMEAIATKLRLT